MTGLVHEYGPRYLLQYATDMNVECSYSACGEPARTMGLCNRHYQQHLKGTELTDRPANRPVVHLTCSGPQCFETAKARGLCGGHYQQHKRGNGLTVLRKTERTDIRDDQGRKRCSKCGDWFPEDQFFRLRSQATRDGLSTNCNLCDRLFRYHITAAQYHEMLEKQGGMCAICRRVPPSFHVDHDHACCPERKKSCGKCVRGLLCADCNGALGLMADDPERLLNAASYLKEVRP